MEYNSIDLRINSNFELTREDMVMSLRNTFSNNSISAFQFPPDVEHKAVIVYQSGIANVFEVDCFNLSSFGREAKRLYQGTFYGAETFARALVIAGWKIASFYCNMAGDVAEQQWHDYLIDAPFSSEFHPVFQGVLPSREIDDYYHLRFLGGDMKWYDWSERLSEYGE